MMNLELLKSTQNTIVQFAARCAACKTDDLICDSLIHQAKKIDVNMLRMCVRMLESCLEKYTEKSYAHALGHAIEECSKLIRLCYDVDNFVHKGHRTDLLMSLELCVAQCAIVAQALSKVEQVYKDQG